MATEAATTQSIPGTFSTAITVLNPPSNPTANVVLDFYDANGNIQSGAEQKVAVSPGQTAFWYVPNIAGLSQGQTYSAVVSSDQQVYASVNLGGANPTTGETYDGAGTDSSALAVSPTEYIASVLKEYHGFSSTVVVQNAGSTATDITVTLNGNGTSQTFVQKAVAPNAAYTLDLESTSLPNGFTGGATITNSAAQPLAVITNQYTPTITPALFGSTNGFSSSAGTTTAFIPGLYKNYHGFTSALIVQNADSVAANVTVTYANGAKDGINGLAPGASQVFFTPNNAGIPNGQAVGATVTSNAKILTQVNIQAGGSSGIGLASYNGFTGGTTNVFAPGLLVNYHTFNTALTIQNVSTTQTATVTVTYSNSSKAPENFNIGPGQSQLLYTPNEGLPSGYNGGATIVSTNGVPIVGLVNIQGVTTADQLFSTNAFGS